VCLELPQERLDVFFVFVVVGVDGAVADDVGCGRDIAADGRFVLETEAWMELVWAIPATWGAWYGPTASKYGEIPGRCSRGSNW